MDTNNQPTTIYWRDVVKLRRLAGAQPVIVDGKSFTFEGKTAFWYAHEYFDANAYLLTESKKSNAAAIAA